MNLPTIVHKLFEMGAVKFGSFTLKSGIQSPIYIDLRVTISNPKLLVAVAEAMHEKVLGCPCDLICGVPYTALPFATVISVYHDIPMILRRKEKKEYGTAQRIEGKFSPGQKCLIVEDVITSGQSVLDTAESLFHEQLLVEDIIVFVDREQGGKKRLSQKGFRVHSICTITEIATLLLEDRKIEKDAAESVFQFIKEHKVYV